MNQFAYRATDRLGNVVDGSIAAADHVGAILQLQKAGLTPIGVQIEGVLAQQAQPTAAVGIQTNGPRDLTQPVTVMPTAAADLFIQPTSASDLNTTTELSIPDMGLAAYDNNTRSDAGTSADDTTVRMGNLEPWERAVLDPATGLPRKSDVTTAMAPRIEQPRYRASTIRGLENIPFGANSSRSVPINQRINEVLIYPIVSGVKLKDLAQWYRQLGTLIGAGLNLNQSLAALADNTKNVRLKAVTEDGVRQVRAGGYFSDVMAAYPWIFPPMHLEMLRASEQGGLVSETLRQIGDYVEHEMEVRRLISRETLYPKIVLFVLVMLMGGPGIFGGMPAIATWFLGGPTSQYLLSTFGFALTILLPILVTVVLFRLFAFNSPAFRNMYDQVKINLPVLGKIIRNFAIGKFARTYSALTRAGFPSSSALQIAGDASGNVVIARAGQYAMRKAEQGHLPSQALAETRQFTAVSMDMLRTAELSGAVDDMMEKVADYHEEEAKSSTHTVAMIFSVFVLLAVGVIVGFTVIGAYTGYAHSVQSASGS